MIDVIGGEDAGTASGLTETPAGRDRAVIDMDDGELLSFGACTGDVAVALARAPYGAT